MAGRAGRRGKDVRGSVIYLPAKEPESLASVKLMMTGPRTTFQSRMTFYYDFLLKTLQTGNVRWIDVMKNSYWSCKQDQRVVACRRELADVETALKACELTPAQIADMEEFDALAAAVKGTGNAERKVAQRALEGWKQRHMGPVWWKIEKEMWRKYTGLQRDRAAICDDIERLVAGAEDDVDRTLSALEAFGFFDKGAGALTPAGVVASEVNEGHPILMSMFYTGHRDLLKTREEVLAFLAHFLPHSKDEGSGAVPPSAGLAAARKALEGLAAAAEQIERGVGVMSPKADYWTIHTFYVEIIWRLVNGEAPIGQLCADYGLFEGNIIRILSSMLHLLEEWRNMATLSNDTHTLEMLVDAETLISPAGSVCTNGESIYLRL
jgi:superfamily II RNA helicase